MAWKTGNALADTFPDSKLIQFRELPENFKIAINAMEENARKVTKGATVGPASAILFDSPLFVPGTAAYVSFYAFRQWLAKQKMLGHWTKQEIAPGLSFENAQKKYSHIIWDTEKNVLLVKASNTQMLKQRFHNVILSRSKIKQSKIGKQVLKTTQFFQIHKEKIKHLFGR